MKNAQVSISVRVFVVICIFFLLFLNSVALSATQTMSLDGQYAISRLIGENQNAYYFQKTGEGTSLINSSQNFEAILSDDADLEIMYQGHYIKMCLAAFGFGQNTRQPQPAHVGHIANRIVYDQGLLRQWFVNGPMGLQQGFTLDKRPENKKNGNLILTLNVDSDLYPRLAADGRSVDFVTTDETVALQYAGLMVVDADASRLPAHIEIHQNQIDIVVDDRNAIYPVVVDPIFQQAKLTASDGAANDRFGHAVAIEGNTVVVGAVGHDTGNKQGAVYVYKKPATGWANMTQIAKLTAGDGTTTDRFGSSVAISNGTIAVGADSAYGGVSIRPGAAYIFVKPPSGWTDVTESSKLTPSDGGDQDRFGGSIAISNDTVVVGADGANTGGNVNQGKAYIFVKPPSGWTNTTETAQLTAGDGIAGDYFGQSVSLYSDNIVVGAPGDQDDRGSVYVFTKPQTGWTDIHQTAKFMASDGAANDYLGFSVAIENDTIVAGAPDQTLTGVNQGAVYIFVKSGADWISRNETAKLTATDAMTGDEFGKSVGFDNGTIVVGSPNHNYSGTASNGLPLIVFNTGALYIFSNPSGAWHDMTAKAQMRSSDGCTDDHLGSSVAISGSTIIAGAPEHDTSGNEDQGAAYVFPLNHKTSWPLFISAITSHVGYVIAGNKRVNAPDPSDNTTTYTKYIGTMTLEYGNTTIPHFNKRKDSFCTLWMPVNGNIGQLTCSSEILAYDAVEEDGQSKFRYMGSINFQPMGTCNKSLNTCSVDDGASGSETQWLWTWNGTSWEPVAGTPWTATLDGFGNTYNFALSEVLSGGETIGGTVIRTLRWTLWLMPAP